MQTDQVEAVLVYGEVIGGPHDGDRHLMDLSSRGKLQIGDGQRTHCYAPDHERRRWIYVGPRRSTKTTKELSR